jgi:membrane fusion protein (multidrug efflux system)
MLTTETARPQVTRTSAPAPVKRRRWPKTKFIVTFVIFFVGLLVVIGGIKALQIATMVKMGQPQMPPTTVTSTTVQEVNWAPELGATGSVVAMQGAVVSSELGGVVEEVRFESGAAAKKGDVLVRLAATSEDADLALAQSDLARARDLASRKVISKSDLDAAEAKLQQKQGAVEKKEVRAPFDGQLGIRQVNVGQMIPAGQPVVSLQALDPIYVNFALPQQHLDALKPGLDVRVTSDAIAGREFKGKLTAINSAVDEATRNVQVQATFENPEHLLKPGMYVRASIILPQENKTLIVPNTAIAYAPYGDSVFVIEKKQDPKTNKEGLGLRQQFVRTGETRGDFVAITNGVKAGEQIVSSGVFKLRNGAPVVIDNKLAPKPSDNPKPPNT